MAYIKITLADGDILENGKLVTFRAPCNCDVPEGVMINEQEYALVDSLCNDVLGGHGAFAEGSLVTVTLDVDNSRAFIQNAAGATLKDIPVALLLANWVSEADGSFSQTVSVEGLSEDSSPSVMLQPAHDRATDEENYSYACISDIIVSQGFITFYASEKPPISFTVLVKSVIAAQTEKVLVLAELVDRISAIEKELKDVGVALLLDDWVLDEETGTYSQAVTIEGLGVSSDPIIAPSSDDELDAFVCISETLISEDTITFIADEKPTVSFVVIVKGVTANETDQIAELTEIVGRLRELENDLGKIGQEEVLAVPNTPIPNVYTFVMPEGQKLSDYKKIKFLGTAEANGNVIVAEMEIYVSLLLQQYTMYRTSGLISTHVYINITEPSENGFKVYLDKFNTTDAWTTKLAKIIGVK